MEQEVFMAPNPTFIRSMYDVPALATGRNS